MHRGVPSLLVASLAFLTAGCAAVSAASTSSAGVCPAGQLSIAYWQPPVAAAGQLIGALRLVNHGPACAMTGYPGVSLVDRAGHQVAAAASRQPARPETVAVPTGGEAFVELRTESPETAPRCTPPASAIRVYPPGDTAALLVPSSLRICGGVFTTGPVSTTAPFPG